MKTVLTMLLITCNPLSRSYRVLCPGTCVWCLILLFFLSAKAPGQNVRLSLAEAIQEGLRNNPEIQNARIEKQKSQSQLTEQQSKLYPQTEAYSNFYYYYALPRLIVPGEIFGQEGDIAAEFGTKYDWSSGFKATQVIYNQSYFTSLKIARRKTEIEQFNQQQKQEDLAYRIAQVYYLCLVTRQQAEHMGFTLKNMEQLLRITELQQQNGIIRKVDHDQVLVDQNNLETEIDNLNQLYAQQTGLLKYLIGIKWNTGIELTGSLTPSPVPEQAVPDWGTRTEIKNIDTQFELARLSGKMNKQEYLPVLSGFAQYYYQGQRDRFDFFKGGNDKFYRVGFTGLSLSIPVFDGFEKREKIRQQNLILQQLQNTREHTLHYFNKEFLDASLQYKKSRAAVVRQEENIQIAEENYQVALQAYQEQTLSLADLLRAQNSLTEARLSCDNALLQLKNAELDLIKSRGELLNHSGENKNLSYE